MVFAVLKNMEINNFKTWLKGSVSFGKVTGLFGTNSSGKSSLIQFLLMLKQSKNSSDRGIVLDFGGPNDELINLGSYTDVVHRHENDLDLQWELTWSLNKPLTLYDSTRPRTTPLTTGKKITTRTQVYQKGKAVIAAELSYEFSGYRFSLIRKSGEASAFSLEVKPPEGSDFRFLRNQQRAWALPGPLKTYLFPDQAKTYYQNADLLGSLESEYESLFDSIYYLGPLREPPKREYAWSGSSPLDVGQRGERAIAALLAATERGDTRNLKYKARYLPFQEIIAYWLKELGLIHGFRVAGIGSNSNLYKALVKRDSHSPEVLLTDVGFGVSQVLPALVLLYYVPKGSTIIMEQPEIHLHPSVQSGLADVILRVAKYRNVQVIVESHSEHLLRRFQRRVAEEDFNREDVKLYFCSSKQGQSKLELLDIDIFGAITNWPEQFFGDEMTEIAETQRAILKRKISASST